jgi:hypothetical protein
MILSATIEHFTISKPTASKYINELIDEGVVKKESSGRYPKYHLVDTVIAKTYRREDDLEEDVLWREDFFPQLAGVANNVKQACQYGFTEILNNAIDHSGSDEIKVRLVLNAKNIQIHIKDYGIGIFDKIQKFLFQDIRYVRDFIKRSDLFWT